MSDQQQQPAWHAVPTCEEKWIRLKNGEVRGEAVQAHHLQSSLRMEWYRNHGPWFGPIPQPPESEVQA